MESKFYNEVLCKFDDLITFCKLNCERGDIFYTSVIDELLTLEKKIIERF